MTFGLSYKPGGMGGGVAYTGLCRLTGYGFWPLVLNRVNNFFVSVLNRLYFLSFFLDKDLK